MKKLLSACAAMRALVLAACCSVLAANAASSAPSTTNYPPPIKMAVTSGMQVVRNFPAVSGLKGWVLSKDGRYTIAFTTPDGKTMIVGVLVDKTGANLTARYGDKYIPKPDYATLFPDLGSTGYIVEGAANPPKSVLYVFFDPNCIFCNLTWRALQPYEKVGLQVRWVPVAFLKPTSLGRAAAIMEAKDPAAALQDNESHFNTATEDGGLKPLGKPSPASLSRLNSNGKLMNSFGSTGTPTLVWKDKAGKVQSRDGLPKLSELPAITGLPEQQINDPALARFK
ncbi:MAG: thiol:disulfide interchange protein DsbG [Acidiferrobacterales bacterium]